MIVDHIANILLIFAALWFFGGLALFAWVYDKRLLRFIKKTWAASIEFAKDLGMAAAMLSPFLIPIAVTAICLYFG